MNGKRVTGMILAGAVAASLFGSAPAFAEEPVTVTGIFGEEEIDVTFEKAPERVVSLAGFATEMLLALGLEDRIVGYAWQDNDVLPQYQEAFEKLTPLCEPGMDPGEEVVLAAQPDLVLSWASWSEDDYFSYENLSKNGIGAYGFHCERTENSSLEDVYEDFLNLGKIFRVDDRAEALVGEMQERIAAVQERIKNEEPVSVFVCDIGSSEEQAFTAGGGLPADLISKAGGKNIITDTGLNWTKVSWEVVAEQSLFGLLNRVYKAGMFVFGNQELIGQQVVGGAKQQLPFVFGLKIIERILIDHLAIGDDSHIVSDLFDLR